MILVPIKKFDLPPFAILHLQLAQRSTNEQPPTNHLLYHNNTIKTKMMTVEVIAAVLAISVWPNRGLPLDPMMFAGKLRSQAAF